ANFSHDTSIAYHCIFVQYSVNTLSALPHRPEGRCIPRDLVKEFSMARYLEQLRTSDQEIAPMEDWGEPKGSELGGPDDPTRFDKW
ncbi:hypothetical protein M0D69_43105, partial [Caballeronia sp. SEWSISQ10-4 2]|nr:hypothetical protein [Caballeronia sp. SEWSISQ10-4 2]